MVQLQNHSNIYGTCFYTHTNTFATLLWALHHDKPTQTTLSTAEFDWGRYNRSFSALTFDIFTCDVCWFYPPFLFK